MNEGNRKIWKDAVVAQSRPSPDICFAGVSTTTKTLRITGVLAEIRIENLKN
jgi:hypothetical protein